MNSTYVTNVHDCRPKVAQRRTKYAQIWKNKCNCLTNGNDDLQATSIPYLQISRLHCFFKQIPGQALQYILH